MPTTPLLQRDDVDRICAERGVTLEQFANELVYLQCYGVPLDRVGLIGRAWQLVSEMLDERRALELAETCTLSDRCPHCNSRPRITGGKQPATYCPTCEAVLEKTAHHGGLVWRRWSKPCRPFVHPNKYHDIARYPKCQTENRTDEPDSQRREKDLRRAA